MAEHAKPAHRDRLLPALVLIVACGLLEVWASWLTIGSISGFPKLGGMTTGWILPVTNEAYWTVALYAWLVDAPGPRSRKFAMRTAIAMFILSLTGQEYGHLIAAAHRTAPMLMVMLVTALPLLAVGLGTLLLHFRQLDKEEAVRAARREAEAVLRAEAERAEADERTALRAALDAAETERETALRGAQEAARAAEEAAARAGAAAERQAAGDAELVELRAKITSLTESLAAAETARSEAEMRAADADAKTATLTRKLAAAQEAKRTRSAPAKTPAGSPRKTPAADPATEMPEDFDAQAEALRILAAEPDISGAQLAERVGRSERWGQTFKKNLAAAAPKGPDAGDAK